jgi:hypothetical protein
MLHQVGRYFLASSSSSYVSQFIEFSKRLTALTVFSPYVKHTQISQLHQPFPN